MRRLQRRGYSVCRAIDGPTAVAMAASELPDVILMDVALGEMDGWEATQRIKGNPVTNAIPIIALTAHALESNRKRSIEVGCSDFDTKPVDIERLISKIRALTEGSKSEAGPAASDRRRAARQRIQGGNYCVRRWRHQLHGSQHLPDRSKPRSCCSVWNPAAMCARHRWGEHQARLRRRLVY